MAMNFGDLYDHVDGVLQADVPVFIEETDTGTHRTVLAGEFKRRSNNLAQQLLDLGAQPDDKIAIYQRNRVEYMETTVAAFKARLVHVNVNFRYREDELHYLLDNSDARFIVYDTEFAPVLEHIRDRLDKVTAFIEISDGVPTLAGALDYETLAENGNGEPLQITRSPEDLIFIYTGGTTGLPKGVMWQHSALWGMMGRDIRKPQAPVAQAPEDMPLVPGGNQISMITVLPFMHGAGLYSSMNSLAYGNTNIIMATKGFNPQRVLECIEQYKIRVLTIAGDAFAKPLVDALDANPGQYDLSSLAAINSTAMIFSPVNKRRILAHFPNVAIMDNVGSSESPASAMSTTTKDSDLENKSIVMKLTPNARVFTEDLREVQPGSGETGFLAVTGHLPQGYYKDEKKTAEAFVTVAGVRYAKPGDWCEVLADGTIKFLGRGNICINTGGEKIYPEEVEATLKSNAQVHDCVVVGVPDDRWGQVITAVVEPRAGARPSAEALQEHVREHLAGYKVPRHVLTIDTIGRAASGKADYQRIKAWAMAQLGVSPANR
jgi:fatty-acyl-CoA synthase